MADEPKVPEGTEPLNQDKTFTQSEVDRMISQRLEREKSKYSDYDETKKQVETLLAEKKEREEAELTENEKLKKQIEAKDLEIETHKKNTEWRTEWETKEAEAIETEMEGLTDNQKTIINGLPLEQRRLAISEFKTAPSGAVVNAKKGGSNIKTEVPTLEEVTELRTKFGAGSKEYRDAMQRRMDSLRTY